MIRYILLFLLLPSAVMAQSQSSDDAQPLHFFTEEYAPFSFSSGGDVRGINTELLKRTAEHLGLEVEFAVVPWGRAQMATQRKENTCFFSAARTSEREDLYQWVGPLTREQIILFSLNPDFPELDRFEQASDYEVGGQIADAYTQWVKDQGVAVDTIPEVAGNLAKLRWGRIDLWLAGSIAGPHIASQKDMTVYPQAISDESFELWLACNRDFPEDLIRELNETITQFRSDGTLAEIRRRHR